MGEHTKGPWDVLPACNYVGYAIAPRGTLPTLAAVERPAGRRDTINIHAFNFPGETLPNARLIAASPDLLEALDDLLNVIATNELVPESVSYMQQARAAVAKARGESK